MHLLANILFISLIITPLVKSAYILGSSEDKKNNELENFQHLPEKLPQDGIFFCEIGCVFLDPDNILRIDDPGRNFYDTFSVISTDYVTEVLGGPHGIAEHPWRVMVSKKALERTKTTFQTRVDLQDMILQEGEVIQRITFKLQTDLIVCEDSKSPGKISVRIPLVVPHVIFMYNFLLELEGEAVTGVVTLEVSNLPRTLQVEVGILQDGRCWVMSLDKKEFQGYMLAVRVRGNYKHDVGVVTNKILDFAEYGVLEAYMEQINGFAFEFLQESILQKNSVIRESGILARLCTEILHEPPEIYEPTTEKSVENVFGDPIEFSIDIRSKNESKAINKNTKKHVTPHQTSRKRNLNDTEFS